MNGNAKFSLRRGVSNLVVLAAFLWPDALALGQEVCGSFTTAPGSTVQYVYMPGSTDAEILIVEANFDISCEDFSLRGELLTPIIGVDEEGNEIFPTGLTYPMMIASDYANFGYAGVLQGTQYNYLWNFTPAVSGRAWWNGYVSWFGGRYEETSISDVLLVPEAGSLGWAWLLVAFWRQIYRPSPSYRPGGPDQTAGLSFIHKSKNSLPPPKL